MSDPASAAIGPGRPAVNPRAQTTTQSSVSLHQDSAVGTSAGTSAVSDKGKAAAGAESVTFAGMNVLFGEDRDSMDGDFERGHDGERSKSPAELSLKGIPSLSYVAEPTLYLEVMSKRTLYVCECVCVRLCSKGVCVRVRVRVRAWVCVIMDEITGGAFSPGGPFSVVCRRSHTLLGGHAQTHTLRMCVFVRVCCVCGVCGCGCCLIVTLRGAPMMGRGLDPRGTLTQGDPFPVVCRRAHGQARNLSI